MFETVKTYWTRRRDLAEIDGMSESELADIAATRMDLRRLVDMPDVVVPRMAAMAEVFGLSEDTLTDNRADYVEMISICATCVALSQCWHELAKGEAAEPRSCMFCPNAGRFAEMAMKA